MSYRQNLALVMPLVLILSILAGCTETATKTKEMQPKALSQEERGLLAIKAADDAIAGKSIRLEEYGVTKEEVFDVFKAKVVDLSRRYRNATDREMLESLDSESKRLVTGMERVDPDHQLTREIRDSLK